MIYTLTFNPAIDYIVDVEAFRLGLTNRTSAEKLLPGGKGLNVSTVLHNLGVESTALGFIGGFTGDEIERRAAALGLRTEFIRLKEGFSRINVKLRSIDGTEINGRGPVIDAESMQTLRERLLSLGTGDTLVLAGSIPESLPDTIYEEIMRALSGHGVTIAVDATKELLLNVLPLHPFLVKPNNHELSEIFGVQLKTAEEVAPYAKKLREMGAENVLVSMAGEGAVLAASDGKLYQSPAPKGTLINGVGAGDSMVAGFLAGWNEKKDCGYAFKLGIAAGSASAFSENLATKEEIEAVLRQLSK